MLRSLAKEVTKHTSNKVKILIITSQPTAQTLSLIITNFILQLGGSGFQAKQTQMQFEVQ